MMKILVIVLLSFSALANCSPLNQDVYTAKNNILEVAQMLGATKLISLVEAAGLNSTLSGKGPFTLFAPSNAAIDRLDPWIRNSLPKNISLLKEVLPLHVVSGSIMSSSLSNNKVVKGLAGNNLRANIYIRDSTIVTINGAVVTHADNIASNGVVHLIDDVFQVSSAYNIAEWAKNIPSVFSTVVKAIEIAGLEKTLSGPGPFTVFLPTDEAFGVWPRGLLDYLVKNHPEYIKDLLLYHTVGGCFYSAGLVDGPVQSLYDKQDLTVRLTPDKRFVTVDTNVVTGPNAPMANGVVHVVERVLFPPNWDAAKLGFE